MFSGNLKLCEKQFAALADEGKGPATKSDVLLDKFQVAFDPPSSLIFGNYVANFYDRYGYIYARRYDG